MRVLSTLIVVRGRANPLHVKFPDRLRRARKAAGLNSSALSLAAGISRITAGQLEAGEGVPRVTTVERLANALRLSPSALAYGVTASWESTECLRCDGLAARAKEARTALGLTVGEVEKRAKFSKGAVKVIEAGSASSLDTVEKLATALQISPAWLAYGEGPRDLPRRGAKHLKRNLGGTDGREDDGDIGLQFGSSEAAT